MACAGGKAIRALWRDRIADLKWMDRLTRGDTDNCYLNTPDPIKTVVGVIEVDLPANLLQMPELGNPSMMAQFASGHPPGFLSQSGDSPTTLTPCPDRLTAGNLFRSASTRFNKRGRETTPPHQQFLRGGQSKGNNGVGSALASIWMHRHIS